MAAVIGKRKREDVDGKALHTKKAAFASGVNGKNFSTPNQPKAKKAVANRSQGIENGEPESTTSSAVCIQIVTGSYERVLHGICATIPHESLRKSPTLKDRATSETQNESSEDVVFTDTFLFAAHASSIRCLALSPPTESDKRILATGSSDERISLYSLSTCPPTATSKSTLPSLADTPIAENPRNRSLGNLIHHDRAITRLHFPTKGKLFTAAEDNTIAIARTRDWTVLSSIKAPIPKPQGRPSGDTAAPGEVPAGINDFAIHPSQKLMLSLSRGEKCMRLWNLMTGKKAGVLNFGRELLEQVGEGKHSSGEGRKVLWDGKGEVFVVGFEQGAALFGIDSKPKAVLRPGRRTKFHQMRVLPQRSEALLADVLAVSTEDGRILFFDTSVPSDEPDAQELPLCRCVAQLGGPASGVSGRIKDFEVLELAGVENENEALLLIVAGHSDGTVRLWITTADELGGPALSEADADHNTNGEANGESHEVKQIGQLIGTLDTGNRITCLGAFVMDGKATDAPIGEQEDAVIGAEQDEDESESEGDDGESNGD